MYTYVITGPVMKKTALGVFISWITIYLPGSRISIAGHARMCSHYLRCMICQRIMKGWLQPTYKMGLVVHFWRRTDKLKCWQRNVSDWIRSNYLIGFLCLSSDAPTITSPHTTTLNVSEKQTVQLLCTANGNPTSSINWTRNGVLVGRGSPFNITATPEDHKQCYTCIASNGMPGSKNASVCLAVKCK